MASIEWVSFTCDGYEYQGEPDPGQAKIWRTPEGDGFGVYFFPVPPDLPENASSVHEFAAMYQEMLGDSGARVVETKLVSVKDQPAVQVLLAVPQEPTGITLSVQSPFRFVISVMYSKPNAQSMGRLGLKKQSSSIEVE